ncbi:thaumatin-like protein 1 [Momordica charantia]|uniref:Thaumatin-like protein 1 n=1 Tax=Momordica charantia TaxID=3673 RepID=A0A6J1CYX5_MOMCH|nr:thaumatin-like protein 1 [Momordica charantia]
MCLKWGEIEVEEEVCEKKEMGNINNGKKRENRDEIPKYYYFSCSCSHSHAFSFFFFILSLSSTELNLQPTPPSSFSALFLKSLSMASSYSALIIAFLHLLATSMAATFTFVNRCDFTVWPGILANAGSPTLQTTGFELPTDSSRSFLAPTGWSGRFWGRTSCSFDASGSGSCITGDCGSGHVECNGAGATPPATLAEFTLGTGGQDFYDVSLVDGYNLPMIVEGTGGSGQCASTGCSTDLNRQCPAELRVGEGDACKSACEAFETEEYCCSGAYGSPATCKPSIYSEMFKSACPRSYSYAYDDATSTFTCSGADYTITFCPSSPSQKSSSFPTPTTAETSQGFGSETGSGSGSGSEYGMGYSGASGTDMLGAGASSGSGSGSGTGETMLADGSWLAGLAMGNSAKTVSSTSTPLWMASFIAILSSLFL